MMFRAVFCLQGSLMMEAVRTSETSVDNHFTRQYNPEDSSEHNINSIRTMYAVPDDELIDSKHVGT
jgi:hypothetical protein